jgi:hypothetical protein
MGERLYAVDNSFEMYNAVPILERLFLLFNKL